MYTFKNPKISIATEADLVFIKDLLNSSHRGEGSKQGWTTEAALIAGDTRADESMLRKTMQQPRSLFLKFTNHDQIDACVNLQQHADKLYLGMFSVTPHLQGAGIGKQLLNAAEEYAGHLACKAIYMSVISLRTELIDWYKRHGYIDAEERIPFEEDGITGEHLQKLEFMILEKEIFF